MFRLREELGKKTSRLASLREFQNRYEWCGAGTRSIIRAGEEAGLSLDSVHGLVADHIEVPREHEVAVEAALGRGCTMSSSGARRKASGPSTT